MNKAFAQALLTEVVQLFQDYKGVCRFVINNNGKLCKQPAINAHVISNSSVLAQLKDEKSGTVLHLGWGAEQWKHFFLRSSRDNPLDFYDPSAFEPRKIGTGRACTGLFACSDHDKEFTEWIDSTALDINDPKVAFLLGYRAVLYDTDLSLLGTFFARAFHKRIMRGHPFQGERAKWIRYKRRLERGYDAANDLVTRLGKIWFNSKHETNFAPVVESMTVWDFRSNLKFAATIIVGVDGILTVFPMQGDMHKIVVLSWSKNSKIMDSITKQLCENSANTMKEDSYGVSFLMALMQYGSGITALSPSSYKRLNDENRRKIKEVLMNNANASYVGKILGAT